MLRRPTILAAAIAAAIAASGANTLAAPPEKRLEAHYVISWLGLPVYSAKLAIGWDGGRYRLRLQAEAEGILRLASNTTIDWETSGRVVRGAFQPERFAQANTFRRQTRRITLAYADAGAPAVSVVPPESPGKRPPVPPPLKIGTLDPLSAAFTAFAMPADAKNCGYTAKVFEGLRRTDVRLEHAGSEQTPGRRMAGLDRQAFVCLLYAKRVAGYEDKHFKQNPEPLPPAKLWVARHAAGLWLPAQMRFEFEYGPIFVDLVRVDILTGGGK